MADRDYAKEMRRAKMVGSIRAKGKTVYPKRNYKKELFEAGLRGMKRRTPSPEFNLPTKKPTKRKH